jgi:hypothetical protein
LPKKYGLKVEDLMKGKRGKDNKPRKVGVYLVKELCDLNLNEIDEGFRTGAMARWIVRVTESPPGCRRTQSFETT